tara:strand:+ start:184 stop:1122 length:939 start_codon:yes stop_codon:yes gene_type:complete
MAIFRAGKRVGPFDIRVGFPRDRSYDRIDYPANYTRANPETTIGRFRAMMGKAEGYARPSRFVVRVNLPTNLAKLAGIAYDTATGQTHFTGDSNAITMQQLSSQLGQQVNMHCESVSMPAHDLQSETIDHFGPPRQMVTGHGFTGTIGATFYADKYLRERHFFEMWQKMAVGMTNHKAGYYDDYIGTIQILQLGSLDGEGDRDVPTYGIEATEVYPESVTAIEYNYGSVNQIVRVTVAFQYKQWHNLTTDSIAGMSFGASDQTQHDIAQPDRGLIGKLPPELQRTARDVFTQAKNQVPIGRLFKGKLFPPFF